MYNELFIIMQYIAFYDVEEKVTEYIKSYILNTNCPYLESTLRISVALNYMSKI